MACLDIILLTVNFLGFILVAVGFGTQYWFFSENDRWQFKCDLRTCCVRDIDPTPQFWTCWPIKDPPKVFRTGVVLASCGLGLWLPTILCFLAARAKLYPRQAWRLAFFFLMIAGGIGVAGCRIMFTTAEEYFIIAEVPGISGYMVLYGFYIILVTSVLCSLQLIFQTIDRILNIVGKLLGFVAALSFVTLRASLQRPASAALYRAFALWHRLKPLCVRIFRASVFGVSIIKKRSLPVAVKLKKAFVYTRGKLEPCLSPVIRLLRSRFLPMCAFAVLLLTAVVTFFQTKLAAISTFTLTKLAAVLIVCSPRLYAMIDSVQPLLADRAMLLKVSHQFGLRQRDVILDYLMGLVRPSFEWTLKCIKTKSSRSRSIRLSKAQPLNGITVH